MHGGLQQAETDRNGNTAFIMTRNNRVIHDTTQDKVRCFCSTEEHRYLSNCTDGPHTSREVTCLRLWTRLHHVGLISASIEGFHFRQSQTDGIMGTLLIMTDGKRWSHDNRKDRLRQI